MRASVVSGCASHSRRRPASAASTVEPKRAAMVASNAGSLRNHSSRHCPSSGDPGAPNQKSRTSSGVVSVIGGGVASGVGCQQ